MCDVTRGLSIAVAIGTCLAMTGCGGSKEATATSSGGDKPSAPRVIAPHNAANTGSVRSSSPWARRPAFEWELVDFERAVTYDIEIDDSCEPGRMQKCPFASAEVRRTGIDDTIFRPARELAVSAALPLGTRYYWRLRACAGIDCSPWTRVRYVNVGRTAGDLNGDGYSDVVVGAPLVDNTGVDQGSVFIYYGTTDGLARSARLDDPHGEDNSNFGVSAALAGDVNGDGYDDLVIGAAGSNDRRGLAYLFYGSATGITVGNHTRIAHKGLVDDWFGSAVASAGDVDADGFGDLLIGASGVNKAGEDWGVAYVYMGSVNGLVKKSPTILGVPSSDSYDHFGFAVAGAGDIDGDGYDDVAVGSPGIDRAGARKGKDRGAVFVYRGGVDGVLRIADNRLEAPVPLDHDHFGYAVAGGGDIDADGYDELLVGAPGSDGVIADDGTAYVYRGSPNGIGETASAVLQDPRPNERDRFGTSVTSLGDSNGDGFGDIVIGTTGDDRGRALVYAGTREGIAARPVAILEDPLGAGYNDFAESVGGAGDINGDGFDDLIVGASGSDNGGIYQGSAIIYPGGPNNIDRRRPLRIDDPDRGEHDHFGHVVAGR